MASQFQFLSVAALACFAATAAAYVTTPPGPTMPNTAQNCNKWYLAKDKDTCSVAQQAGGIAPGYFFTWNPDVSRDCLTNFWPGNAYCVGVDATVPTSKPASTTSKPPSTTSKPASTTSKPISTSGSTSRVSTISTTSQNATYSIRLSISTWNLTTPTQGNTFPPKETRAGQPSNCFDWHYVIKGDTCLSIAEFYRTGIDNLLDWNPTLGDDCTGLTIRNWLCIRVRPTTSVTLTYGATSTSASIPTGKPYTPTTFPAVDTSFAPSPTQGALPTNCAGYYQAVEGDRCESVLAQYPMLTKINFFRWNPFLNNNCDGMWAGYFYCIFAGTSATLPEVPTVSTKPALAAPGITTDCVKWYKTSGGDDCDLVTMIFGRFSKADFITWNPSVGGDCAGIKDDVYYCVAVKNTPTTRTTAIPPFPTATTTSKPSSTSAKPSTTSSGVVATPSPVQAGMVNGCKKFYMVVKDDGCWAIANTAGIDLNNFYKWNPAIGTDCAGLWPTYYVCIGI